MTQAQLLPDVEKAVIAYLAADTAIQAITDTVRADLLGPYPMLRVFRAGGPGSRRADRPLLFVDAYGDVPSDRQNGERAVLNLLSRTALQVLYELEVTTLTGCNVSAVVPVVTSQWLPDPLTDQGRYHSAVILTVRPERTSP